MFTSVFLKTSRRKFILLLFIVWRVYIAALEIAGGYLVPKREAFLGPVPLANFDGYHYLTIAQFGYQPYEQAFFPFYPISIGFLARTFLHENYVLSGLLISSLSFLLSLFLFSRLIDASFKKKLSEETVRWSLVFMAFFPTAFYFAGVYTESLFMLFGLTCFYLLRVRRLFWYGIVAALASATRLVGAFFMVPIGLLAYMLYLGKRYNDPLMFIHVQPAFGAERTSGEFILLPQVVYRYIRIFMTVGIEEYVFWIALLEFTFFALAVFLLWKAWKSTMVREWIYFSAGSLLVPSFSGTLSSIPRYILVCFPLYIMLAHLSPRIRTYTLVCSFIIFSILAMLFMQGYWVS